MLLPGVESSIAAFLPLKVIKRNSFVSYSTDTFNMAKIQCHWKGQNINQLHNERDIFGSDMKLGFMKLKPENV